MFEYPIDPPPFKVKPFNGMKRRDAEQYFEWFVNRGPSRIALLINAYDRTGGGGKSDLDKSPQSMLPLWKWMVRQIRTVVPTEAQLKESNEALIAFVESVIPNDAEWDVESTKDRFDTSVSILSRGTRVLCWDAGYYFAVALTLRHPKAHWGLCDVKHELNKPKFYLTEDSAWFEPGEIIEICALQFAGGNHSQDSLYNLFMIRDDIANQFPY